MTPHKKENVNVNVMRYSPGINVSPLRTNNSFVNTTKCERCSYMPVSMKEVVNN